MLSKIFDILGKTRSGLLETFNSLAGKTQDKHILEKLEEQLLLADIGIEIVESVIDVVKYNSSVNLVIRVKDHLLKILPKKYTPFKFSTPTVILMVGVNGTGKTTSCAKLAKYYKAKGQKVMLIAADTYRAAAVEQLKFWARQLDCDFIYNDSAKEPSSVLFDGLSSAQAKHSDLIIVDTAGRLHTYDNLMSELEKLHRIILKRFTDFDLMNLITIDASLGQNSLAQAKQFSKHIDINGIVLTKLDGTAKGGIIFPLYKELNLPVNFICVGEKINDIENFDPNLYLDALLGENNET
tara:strand:- start:10158 stop:11045 length:888 start_codon:yes stop_codon:yes gene_type:complete